MTKCEQGCCRGLKDHVQGIHDARLSVWRAQRQHQEALARLDLANVRVRLADMRVEALHG